VDGVAARVTDHLHLDVPRVLEKLLQKNRPVPERRLGLPPRALYGFSELGGVVTARIPRPPPPALALTRTG
jgi:hypothetical protein